jgi:hypothetical protein
VDFDLGASYLITKLAVWNISLKDVTAKVADTPEGLATAPLAGAFRLTDHTSFSFSYPVDVLSLDAPAQGRYVRLEIASAYPLAPGLSFAYAIVGEVVASVAGEATVPTVSISREANGDVTVSFTGTLQSAANLGDIFIDVPGTPHDHFTVSAGSQTSFQLFRARGNN